MTTLLTIPAGAQSNFAPLTGAKFTKITDHPSRWGMAAHFDNGIQVLFIAGSPLVNWWFSKKRIGLTATGLNDRGLPELK